MTGEPQSMESEFDTVAAWTVDAITTLGPDYAVPGSCRGSASPAALAWLTTSLDISRTDRVLDAGGGLGGPAAWLAGHTGAPIVVAEPMVQAVAGARRLFALPGVAAWGESLPFRAEGFDAAWSLAVLCTTDDHRSVLTELRRVLRPGGRLGLLVYVAVTDRVPDPPEGNHFPALAGLRRDIAAAGLTVVAEIGSDELDGPPDRWEERIARVQRLVEARHRSEGRWQEADAQERRLAQLLGEGHITAHLLHTVRPVNGRGAPATT